MKTLRFPRLADLAGFALLAHATTLAAANRVALVIGNNHYTNLTLDRQLASPVTDARDVAAALKSLGYTLVTGGALTDAGKDAILSGTEAFARAAKDAEAAVFYYSGHGVQVGEDNYLLPSDAPELTGISILKNRAVLLRDSVMVALEEANVANKVIILDCCRDNPFAAQLESAMGRVGKSIKTKSVGEISGYGPGFYLAFATSPGTTADDGNGKRNSPFTAALLQSLPGSAGKDIDFFFRDVKSRLSADQVSWTNHSLIHGFALGPVDGAPSSAPSALPTVMESPPAEFTVEAPTLPARGYFSLSEVFSGTRYQQFNGYSRGKVMERVQQKLRTSGVYQGESDGDMGPVTQKAILDWQRQQGLALTGRLDEDTQRSLGVEAITESHPPQPRPQRVVASRPAAPMVKSAAQATTTREVEKGKPYPTKSATPYRGKVSKEYPDGERLKKG